MTCRNNEIYEFLHTLLNLPQNTTREEKVCNFTCCVVKLSEVGVNTSIDSFVVIMPSAKNQFY